MHLPIEWKYHLVIYQDGLVQSTERQIITCPYSLFADKCKCFQLYCSSLLFNSLLCSSCYFKQMKQYYTKVLIAIEKSYITTIAMLISIPQYSGIVPQSTVLYCTVPTKNKIKSYSFKLMLQCAEVVSGIPYRISAVFCTNKFYFELTAKLSLNFICITLDNPVMLIRGLFGK